MLRHIYKFLIPYKTLESYNLFNIWNKLVLKFIQFYMPKYYKISKKEYGLNTKKRKKKIIISLTTIPSRLDKVSLCIEGLLRQTIKPDKIILWLAKSEFKDIILNEDLISQKKRGLEIHYCDNLKAHKKYYYTIKKYPNDIVITVDDDTYYPEDLIENMIKIYKDYKHCVICYAAHEITFKNNEIQKYSAWNSLSPNAIKPSYMLMAVGWGGVLYPPYCLNKNFLDKEKIKELCFYSDDLWLKAMELLNGTKVKKVNRYTKNWAVIPDTQKQALFNYNVIKGKNDIQLKNVLKEYNIDLKLYCDIKGS